MTMGSRSALLARIVSNDEEQRDHALTISPTPFVAVRPAGVGDGS